jgi:hypothetical protein
MKRVRACILVCSALALSFAAGRALAQQPQWLVAALVALQGASNELGRVPQDPAGHRDRARAHIDQAMAEVKAAIDYLRF